MAKRPVTRIAILKADIPVFGDYGLIFGRLLNLGALHLGIPESDLEQSDYDVTGDEPEYPKLEDIDAILITGSKFNSFDDTPWIQKLTEFTKTVLAQDRVRIVGVCFGHQIIARALGVMPQRNPKGWELSVTEVDLEPEAAKAFGKSKISIQQFHQDIVPGCPDGVATWGANAICANQAMYAPRRLISVQGHPEFDGAIVHELLDVRHAAGRINKAQFEDALHRCDDVHDGELISSVFLRFLLDGREEGATFP